MLWYVLCKDAVRVVGKMKKKVLVVFGTRPEAIKMCPLVKELRDRDSFATTVCVTGQHREMLDQVLEAFAVVPEYDLAVMKEKQSLFDVTTEVLNRMQAVINEVRPEVVLVHGDTTTTLPLPWPAFTCRCRWGTWRRG